MPQTLACLSMRMRFSKLSQTWGISLPMYPCCSVTLSYKQETKNATNLGLPLDEDAFLEVEPDLGNLLTNVSLLQRHTEL